MEKFFRLDNGFKIPNLGFGTWQVAPGDETKNSVLYALQNGYDHIDTATAYQNEASVGEAIAASGRKREELFITTKLFNQEGTYQDTINAIEESLKLLQLDYIDLYLIHCPNPLKYRDDWATRNAECYRAMEEMYQQGKLKAIGVSNFLVHHFQELEKTWEIVPHVNQIFITPGTLKKDVIEYCQANKIMLEAYSTLGRGHIVNNLTMLEIGAKYNKTPAQLTVRWCLQQGFVTLIKSITESRILENLEVYDFEIEDSDMEIITNLPGSKPFSDPDKWNF